MVSWPVPARLGPSGKGRKKTKAHRPTSVPTDKHTIRFIPHENGVHSIDVKFNGAHIPGSPFKIRVGEQSQAGDPGLVSAYGPGLEGGTTGECLGPGRGVDSADEPQVLAEVCSGEPGPIPALGPKPFLPTSLLPLVSRCVVRVHRQHPECRLRGLVCHH